MELCNFIKNNKHSYNGYVIEDGPIYIERRGKDAEG